MTALRILIVVLLLAPRAFAYTYCGGWATNDVVMNPYPKPVDTFRPPAEYQMAEWNLVQGDTSRPFRVLATPEDRIAADDGYNSLAFLTEANLLARFGLDFADSLAWTVSTNRGGCTAFEESDVIFDANGPWSLEPADEYWFQSTALHELGHVLGFDHYNDFLSIMNSGVNKRLRGETLYMDDREGFRDYYAGWALPAETDVVLYPKYHDGLEPAWMSLSARTVNAGDDVSLWDVTLENLGTTTFASLRAGVYLSADEQISSSDTLLGWVTWSDLGRFTGSLFDADVTIPAGTPSGTYYLGMIVDDVGAHVESHEDNNTIVAVDGTPDPASITVIGNVVTTSTSTTTSTTVPPTALQCPSGFHCDAGVCVANPVPRKQCAQVCSGDVTDCSVVCLATKPKRRRRCARKCRRATVRSCRQLGHCPSTVRGVVPGSCAS